MKETSKLQEFKKAILYLKRKERVRNNADVATALEISSSYLSQMLHGNKPVTEIFYKKFETLFAINLEDPFTYTDLDWVTLPNQNPDAPDNNQELFDSMKSLLFLKDEEIANQRKIISSQQKLVTVLQQEIACMKPVFEK